MPFPKMRLEAARAADQSTPVEAGMSSVTVSLEVSFEFAD